MNSNESLNEVINFVTFPSKLLGLWVIDEKMRVQKFLVFYACLFQIIELSSGVYCIFNKVVNGSLDVGIIEMADCILFSIGSLFFIKMFLADYQKLISFISAINKTVDTLKELKVRIKFNFIIHSIFLAFIMGFFIILNIVPRYYVWSIASPFIFILICQQLSMFCWIGGSLLNGMIEKVKSSNESELQRICRLHSDFCSNFEEFFNDLYQYNVLIFSAMVILTSVDVALKFTKYSSVNQVVASGAALLMALFCILITTSAVNRTSDKSGKLIKAIYSRMIDEDKFLNNPEARLLIKYKEQIKFNVCGFFVWDRPYFLSMIATLLTNFIILIQG